MIYGGIVPVLTLMVGPQQVYVDASFLALAPNLRSSSGGTRERCWCPFTTCSPVSRRHDHGGEHGCRARGRCACGIHSRASLEATTGVEVLRISDYSAENKQRLLTEFAYDGIPASLVMDRTQEACDFAVEITAMGGAIVLANNGSGEVLVTPVSPRRATR